MKRRVIVSAAVLVSAFAMAVVFRPAHSQPKATRHTDKSTLAASASPQAESSIFSILGQVSPALAPSVTTDPATNLAFTSATLNGTVLTAGSSPIKTRGFEYGLTDSYGSTTTENVPGSYDYVAQFGASTTANGQLYNPHGITIDSSGDIYVVDTLNHRVQKFNSSGVYQSQFGSYGSGDGQFNEPRGIAVDSSGNVYVADTKNCRIQKFNSSGVFQLKTGGIGSGNGQFNEPQAVAIDSTGNIYVSDTYNHRIQKLNSSGVYQSKFGALGSGNSQFNLPRNIVIDSSDNIYVADYSNNRIQKFNSSGTYQYQLGGFSYLTGIAVDSSGNVYAADRFLHHIRKYNSSGASLYTFGVAGSGDGQFTYAQGVAVDSTGNIFVTDTTDYRVQKFNNSGVYQSQFGAPTADQLVASEAVAIDASGNIYVVDSNRNRVQKFNSSGVYQSQFGTAGSGNGQFSTPKGIAIDSSGSIYISDSGNNRIQKFNSSGVYQSQFGSYGATDGLLSNPHGLAIDGTNNLFVVDNSNYRVQKFNSSGVYQSKFGSSGSGNGQFGYPTGIAIDSTDDIYVVDANNFRVAKFNSSGVYQSTIGSWGNSNGQFSTAYGIAVDDSDNVYVADTANNRIQKFNSSGVYQSKFGTLGSGNSQLNIPRGVVVDSSGDIFVADTGNYRIQKLAEVLNEGSFSANISGLTCGTTYHYRAYANNSAESTYGNDATLVTAACQPDPPTNLSAITSSSSSIDLSWDAPVYTGDSAIASYVVNYKKVGDISWQAIPTYLGSNTSYTLSGLDYSTEYVITVVARNSTSHDSVASVEVTATTAGNPSPHPPTNLQATILSSTSIGLSWDAPANTGSSPIDYYYIGYQEVGSGSWNSIYTSDDTASITLTGLQPSTQYDIKVSAINVDGYGSDESSPIIATTATPGLNLISTCQQFQDIQNHLTGNYELANNIDCSDTVNWNGGAGFAPIGDIFNQVPFSGILAGNNYSISDLYINQSGGEYAVVAPFGLVSKALIHDIRIVRPVVMGSSHSVTYASGLVAALFQDGGAASSIVNVHITGAQVRAELDSALPASDYAVVAAGGLVAIGEIKNTTQPPQQGKNKFVGSIDVSGPVVQLYVGGLYGQLLASDLGIQNSYATADINVNNTTAGSGHRNFVGGLLGYGQVGIDRSYASGSISLTTADPAEINTLGGLVGVTGDTTISNSFARVSITNPTPAAQQYTGGFVGVIDSATYTSANNAFDADVAGTGDCMSPLLGVLGGCTAISGQPNYFYNNSTNAPLNTWDFTNIWNTTSTLPVFDKKVLTTITAIPPSRLPGYVPPAGTVFPQASGAPTVGPVVLPKLSLRTFGEKFLPPVEEPTSLIEQLKKFLRNVPEVVLVTFPYAFFSLLLIGALALLVEVWFQAKRLRATKLLIARQEAVAKERDTFWHLAANYLRAPITLMVGGIELLSDDKTPGISKLQTLSKQLQTKVGTIMERIEDSKSLQDITRPKAEAPKRVLSLVRFWAPVVAVGMLAVAMNVVATSYRNINLSLINLGMQVMMFVIVSLLLYWVLGALGIVSSKRKQAEALLAKQTANLDGARSEFIAQSATDLDKDLAQLQHELDGMHTKAATGKAAAGTATAMAIVSEGAHRLRDLIDSFELLVAAQNNKLGQLSPQNARTDLHTIVSGALVPLQPVITEKHLTIHTGTMNNMVVPGNSLLLNQVVGSVLANAVAFSPAGSTIELSLKQAKGSVQLVVTNQGTPISKDEISHVFSPLTKADGYDGLQLDHDGLGVNLYIDKLIMEHLGGGIHVASSATRGTTMTMQWPMTQAG